LRREKVERALLQIKEDEIIDAAKNMEEDDVEELKKEENKKKPIRERHSRNATVG